MEYGDFVWQAKNALSQIFNIPMEWFEFPSIIFYFIIPFTALIAMWLVFMTNKIRFFRNSAVNAVLSFFFAFFSLWIVVLIGPSLTVAMAVSICILVMGGRITLIKIILGIASGIAIMLFYPILMSLFVIT